MFKFCFIICHFYVHMHVMQFFPECLHWEQNEHTKQAFLFNLSPHYEIASEVVLG